MINSKLLKNAIEASRDGIVITESNRGQDKIIYVNSAFMDMTGYSKTEIIGENCRFLQGNKPDTSKSLKIKKAINNSEQILITLLNFKKNGCAFWNELSISPIKNDLGEATHHIGIQKDVTKKVELEQKLLKANQLLSKLSYIDQLTQIPNRRAYEETLDKELRIAKRINKPLTLLIFDIDYFKQYNDIYGHECGDDALVIIANNIKSLLLRVSDFIARYGGEEFVVILPFTTIEESLHIADKIIRGVISLNIVHQHSKFSERMTVSVGVSSTESGFEKLFMKADNALYQAKNNGRNRVEAYK
jgi:diguanylate cyclase (GGDEF)-like protein/PAS domain S-box-containing protein